MSAPPMYITGETGCRGGGSQEGGSRSCGCPSVGTAGEGIKGQVSMFDVMEGEDEN